MALSTTLVNRARRAAEATLDSIAEIQRRQETQDNSGGRSLAWPVVATYPCSYGRSPLRPVERETGVRIQAFTYWQFLFPSSADVGPSDRIAVDGRTFEVVGTGHSSAELLYEVIAQEIL